MSSALAVLLPGFVGTTLPGWLESRLRDGLAGVCIFGENIESREQLRELTDAIRAANPAALIAIDEEGGDVTRLYYDQGSPYPGNALLGRIDDVGLTRTVARTVGAQLREVGVNLDFAPSVDVNSNADNPVIGVRSFGADPELVSRHAAAWVAGIESAGVASSAKHFPGHGDTALDSHLSLPIVDQPRDVLLTRELPPFAAAIAAGASSIMTSHIMLPQLDAINPATFSHEILENLLRGELGFAGVIVSDALDMVGASGEHGIPEAAVRAIVAGCDLLCIGTKNTDEQIGEIAAALDEAVATDRLPADRLANAGARNQALAQRLAPPSGGREPEPQFDLDRTAAAFAIREAVQLHRGYTVVALDTETNIAVGIAPWGPIADVRLSEGDSLPVVPGQMVVVGKDNHRHAWVRELIETARTRDANTVVVDMGWPDDAKKFADVCTFGASRHVGEALSAWLGGAAR